MIGFLAEGGATPPPAHNNFGDTMSDGVAGPLALLIIVLLALATVLLIRNMNARLRRLPERFPDQPPPDARRRAGGGHEAAADRPGRGAGAPGGDGATNGATDPAGGTGAGPDSTARGVPTGPSGPAGS